MRLSARCLISVVVLATLFLSLTVSITSDCMATSNFILLPTDDRQFGASFWVFIKNKEAGTYLKVRIYRNKAHYISITRNTTHVYTKEILYSAKNKLLSNDVVSWPACPEWRLFHVAVDRSNTFSITDIHHNKTWITKSIPFSITEMEIEMRQFDVSCTTTIPIRKVEAGAPQVIYLTCNWDVIHFTLKTNETARPNLTVGNATFFLDSLSPSQPRLILTLKRSHTPTPRMVTHTWGTVVEVGSAISNLTLSSLNNTGAFTIQQHFYLQACSSENQDTAPLLGLHSWHLFLLAAVLAAVVVASVSVAVVFFRRKQRAQHSAAEVPQKFIATLQQGPQLYLERLPAPRESQVYLEPLPAPATARPAFTEQQSRMLSANHVYESFDYSSSGEYDDFED